MFLCERPRLGVSEYSRVFTHSPARKNSNDERKSLDATESKAMTVSCLGIQTRWSSYPYKQLLRSPRPPRYNLNSQHDVTLQSDKRPCLRPWKLVLTLVVQVRYTPLPVRGGPETRVVMKLTRCSKEGTDT